MSLKTLRLQALDKTVVPIRHSAVGRSSVLSLWLKTTLDEKRENEILSVKVPTGELLQTIVDFLQEHEGKTISIPPPPCPRDCRFEEFVDNQFFADLTADISPEQLLSLANSASNLKIQDLIYMVGIKTVFLTRDHQKAGTLDAFNKVLYNN